MKLRAVAAAASARLSMTAVNAVSVAAPSSVLIWQARTYRPDAEGLAVERRRARVLAMRRQAREHLLVHVAGGSSLPPSS
jgi:hypothetical protein